jgi:NADH:ubiquinone oxidoreductase subunit 5 (subunit L)/multisubunit Na+/H+ antiporter MnhA subunit
MTLVRLMVFANHGLFKSLLCFGAGSVLHATGTREMSRIGGRGSAGCF